MKLKRVISFRGFGALSWPFDQNTINNYNSLKQSFVNGVPLTQDQLVFMSQYETVAAYYQLPLPDAAPSLLAQQAPAPQPITPPPVVGVLQPIAVVAQPIDTPPKVSLAPDVRASLDVLATHVQAPPQPVAAPTNNWMMYGLAIGAALFLLKKKLG